jgi:hypothetical protein
MIKKLLSAAILAFSVQSLNAQSFSLFYPFSSVTASTGVTDPTPAPTATGVISGSFTAVGLNSNPTTTNVFAFQGWPAGATPSSNVTFTGSLDPAKYYEIVLTPSVNYVVSLTDMYFYMNRSNTGGRHWAIRTNKDGYAANLPATAMGTGNGTVITVQGGDTFFWSDWAITSSTWFNTCKTTFTGAGFTNQFTPFNIRIHAWDGTSTAGSWRIDSVAINGTATFSAGVGLPKLTHDLNAKFQIYPNPANDGVVMIEAKNNINKVEVINILGAVVSTQNALAENKIKLDLATLPEGTYFVRISSGDKVTTEKLIISK